MAARHAVASERHPDHRHSGLGPIRGEQPDAAHHSMSLEDAMEVAPRIASVPPVHRGRDGRALPPQHCDLPVPDPYLALGCSVAIPAGRALRLADGHGQPRPGHRRDAFDGEPLRRLYHGARRSRTEPPGDAWRRSPSRAYASGNAATAIVADGQAPPAGLIEPSAPPTIVVGALAYPSAPPVERGGPAFGWWVPSLSRRQVPTIRAMWNPCDPYRICACA